MIRIMILNPLNHRSTFWRWLRRVLPVGESVPGENYGLQSGQSSIDSEI